MKVLTLKNPKPQSGWIELADVLKERHGWKRESQKLIIRLTEKYKMPQLVALQNQIVEMVKRCNEIKGIEIYYEDILIHETITTIPQGVIEPRLANEIETVSDKRQFKIFESGTPYYLKIH